MKINKDYFALTPLTGRVKYFLNQKNIFDHIIDRIKWHIFPKLHITPNFPTHLEIEAASICQLKCPMCGQRLMSNNQRGVMDFRLYKKIIDECAKRKVYSIKLSWRGEPLLNPRIWDMVRYAKNKGIKDVAFLTNGAALKEKELEKLIDSGLDWISFSIDGLGKTYERIRYPAKFDDIVFKLKKLKELKEKRGTKKPLVRIQSIFSAIKDDPEKYFNFWSPIVDKINFIADELRSEKDKPFQQDPNYVCPVPWHRMVITYDGIATPCQCDYLIRNPLGDVKRDSLYKIWHGEAYRKFRDLQKKKHRLELESCRDCCHGGLTSEREIKVGNKKIKILEYIQQELNINELDARAFK